MRFGFIVPNILSPVSDAEAITRSAKLAESVGFDSLWTSDHILMPDEFPQYGKGTEAITTLAYLAALTERVSLGVSVLVLPMRNPLVVAKQIASVAHFAKREFITGVGVGWNATEYGYLNANFRRRGKLLDEYLDILQTLWRAEKPVHDGVHSFSGTTFSPKPTRPMPIWIGGATDAALERAATRGDAWHPNYRREMGYADKVLRIRERSGGRAIIMSGRFPLDLRGGSAHALDVLGEAREAGLEYPCVEIKHDTVGELLDGIEAFARDVMPALG